MYKLILLYTLHFLLSITAVIGQITPGFDKRFGFHAERVRDPVNVVEIADNLRGVVDGAVIQPGSAQRVDVGGGHLARGQRELLGVGTQSVVDGGKLRLPPIACNRVNVGVGFVVILKPLDLGTEVMRVGTRSVEAVIGAAGHDGQHFALRPREG